MERCADCKFYWNGYCRRNPPELIVHDPRPGYGGVYSAYPETTNDGWCGEFKPKAEAQASEHREPMKLPMWVVQFDDGTKSPTLYEHEALAKVRRHGGRAVVGTWTEELP